MPHAGQQLLATSYALNHTAVKPLPNKVIKYCATFKQSNIYIA